MVAARADFLAAGHYAPLTAAVVAAAGAPAGPVLDVGAGTGTHLAAVLDAAPAAVGVALDISRYRRPPGRPGPSPGRRGGGRRLGRAAGPDRRDRAGAGRVLAPATAPRRPGCCGPAARWWW